MVIAAITLEEAGELAIEDMRAGMDFLPLSAKVRDGRGQRGRRRMYDLGADASLHNDESLACERLMFVLLKVALITTYKCAEFGRPCLFRASPTVDLGLNLLV